MKLYEITSTIEDIIKEIELAEESGDQHRIDLLNDAMNEWSEDLNEKVCAIAGMRENLLVESEAIKAIIKRQQARVKALETKAEWLEGYAIAGMHHAGCKDINTPEMRVRISTGTGSVEITDPTKIPEKFFHVVQSVELSKAELREALMEMKKAGDTPMIDGARLVFKEKLKIG